MLASSEIAYRRVSIWLVFSGVCVVSKSLTSVSSYVLSDPSDVIRQLVLTGPSATPAPRAGVRAVRVVPDPVAGVDGSTGSAFPGNVRVLLRRLERWSVNVL